MSVYWDRRFLQHINPIDGVKYVCEVGARYGDESIELSRVFDHATIFSFECNPNTVNICRDKLAGYKNIKFFNVGLGEVEGNLPFYSFVCNNDGCSSFLKRIDYHATQKVSGFVEIKRLSTILNIPRLDLLCMDVQGFEINVLKGCDLNRVKYIIMEEPKTVINLNYLPPNVYSKYISAPSSEEIKNFMTLNNFKEIERVEENHIEDNVMYENMSLI